jgi:hypothetical protein
MIIVQQLREEKLALQELSKKQRKKEFIRTYASHRD